MSMTSYVAPMPHDQPRNWWRRHWMWIVPVGCLGVAMGFLGFIAILVVIVFGAIRSSDVVQEAVARAESHPSVAQSVGSPIKTGFFVTGNIQVSGASGAADLAIPVSGPRGHGTLYAVATKAAGRWQFSTLVLEMRETGERIDLLADAGEALLDKPPGAQERIAGFSSP